MALFRECFQNRRLNFINQNLYSDLFAANAISEFTYPVRVLDFSAAL